MSDKKLSAIEKYFGVGAEDWEYFYFVRNVKYYQPVVEGMAKFKDLCGQILIIEFSDLTPINPKQEPEFKLGDEVLVSNYFNEWESKPMTFLADLSQTKFNFGYSFLVVDDEKNIQNFKYCRHKPKTITFNGKEYTREELEAQRDEINRLLEDM